MCQILQVLGIYEWLLLLPLVEERPWHSGRGLGVGCMVVRESK